MKTKTSRKYIMYYKELQQNRSPKMMNIFQNKQKQTRLALQQSSPPSLSLLKTIDLCFNPIKQINKSPILDMIPRYQSLFMGHVLDNQNDYKQYLMQTLEQILKKTIKTTQLLFRYDHLNPKANIHPYIDNYPNILLISKTINLYHFVGFSQSPVSLDSNTDGRGMIISLTNRKCYQLHANKKSIKYDKLYLIFGNSELRVCGSQKKVFSNFGINNSHYDSKGDRVDILLGEGNSKEVQLDCFEVHQIIFGSKIKE